MKLDKLSKDVAYGIEFAKAIKLTSDREEMKVVRCILCNDCHNVGRVLKYLGLMPERYNKAIQTGICIELAR